MQDRRKRGSTNRLCRSVAAASSARARSTMLPSFDNRSYCVLRSAFGGACTDQPAGAVAPSGPFENGIGRAIGSGVGGGEAAGRLASGRRFAA